jgi:hypothetical protein
VIESATPPIRIQNEKADALASALSRLFFLVEPNGIEPSTS